MNRAKATLEQWIAGAQAGEAERARQLDGLLAGQQEAVRRLEAAEPDNELKAVAQEVKELVYYVRQRTAFRFGELYNQAFNPAAFREEGLDLKEMLKAAYQDLINRIAFDLSQETLATTLRMEKKFANAKAAQKKYGEWARHIAQFVPSYECEDYAAGSFPTPAVPEGMQGAEEDLKMLSTYYKNGKQFFLKAMARQS